MRRTQRERTAKSCGLDTSTLAFNLVTMLAHRTGDGDKKPITRESTKEAVKTIRAGKAGMFRHACGDLLVSFFISDARLRVRKASGFSCALCFRGTRFIGNSGKTCREKAKAWPGGGTCGERADPGRRHERPGYAVLRIGVTGTRTYL